MGITAQVTLTILAVVVILATLYDIVAIMDAGWDASISSVVYEVSCKYPIIPLFIGILIGHWFWPHARGPK